jgi:hypothetical protein
MAPEQTASDAGRLGFHTDMYLLGAILYDLLAGAAPHDADTALQAMENAINNRVPPLPPGTPRELGDLAMRCLATEPSARPGTVQEFARCIDDYLSGATRRAESRRITTELAARAGFGGYDGLSEASRQLAQAVQQWPENPEATGVRDRILGAYVEEALRRKDLLVARLQLDRITDPVVSARLGGALEAARQAVARSLPRPPLFTWRRVLALLAGYAVVVLAGAYMNASAKEDLLREKGEKLMILAKLTARDVSPDDLRAVQAEPSVSTEAFGRAYSRVVRLADLLPFVRYAGIAMPADPAKASDWRMAVGTRPADPDAKAGTADFLRSAPAEPGRPLQRSFAHLSRAYRLGQSGWDVSGTARADFLFGYAAVADRATSQSVGVAFAAASFADIHKEHATLRGANQLRTAAYTALFTLAMLIAFYARRALARVRLLEREIERLNSAARGTDLSLG